MQHCSMDRHVIEAERKSLFWNMFMQEPNSRWNSKTTTIVCFLDRPKSEKDVDTLFIIRGVGDPIVYPNATGRRVPRVAHTQFTSGCQVLWSIVGTIINTMGKRKMSKSRGKSTKTKPTAGRQVQEEEENRNGGTTAPCQSDTRQDGTRGRRTATARTIGRGQCRSGQSFQSRKLPTRMRKSFFSIKKCFK